MIIFIFKIYCIARANMWLFWSIPFTRGRTNIINFNFIPTFRHFIMQIFQKEIVYLLNLFRIIWPIDQTLMHHQTQIFTKASMVIRCKVVALVALVVFCTEFYWAFYNWWHFFWFWCINFIRQVLILHSFKIQFMQFLFLFIS